MAIKSVRRCSTVMLSTLSSFLTISNNLSKWQAMTAAAPAVAEQNKYYLANIGKVKSIHVLVNNYQLFSYAMTAFRLGNMTYAKGLMTQVLQQGTASSTALARTLNDARILAFAKAFDFAGQGAQVTLSRFTSTWTKCLSQIEETFTA
jgi:hypothetical protein